MPYIRAKINLDRNSEVSKFIANMNNELDHFTIENENCSLKVDAKSVLGVLYASAEFNGELYLVNQTNDGKFPTFVDAYRS